MTTPTPPQNPEQARAEDGALISVLDSLDDDGSGGQFVTLEGGEFRCVTCRATFPASSQDADEVSRLEGASDPADSVMVIPLVCPHCGTAGTWVVHYGPGGSPEDEDALLAMDRTPSEGDNPAEPTPGVH